MFGELPKLFDREFVVAYFLPSMISISVIYLLFVQFDYVNPWFDLSQEFYVRNTTLFGLVSLFLAIFSSILNRPLIRLLEGYWWFALEEHLNLRQKAVFNHLKDREKISDDEKRPVIKKIIEEKDKIKKENLMNENQISKESIQKYLAERKSIKKRLAREFPHEEELILPTSFGNTYRAVEIYSRVMYGLEGVSGWNRLIAVIPDEFQRNINAAKSKIDLWVNSFLLSVCITIGYLIVKLVKSSYNLWTQFNRRIIVWSIKACIKIR